MAMGMGTNFLNGYEHGYDKTCPHSSPTWMKAITNVLLVIWAKVQLKVIKDSLIRLELLKKTHKMLMRDSKLTTGHP